MSVFDSVSTTPVVLRAHQPLDEAQMAAVAFLARYRGRTLESYRADLRQFFQVGRRPRPPTACRHPDPHRDYRSTSGDWPRRPLIGDCRQYAATSRTAGRRRMRHVPDAPEDVGRC